MNFVPVVGQYVRVVSHCHPNLRGKIAKVVSVDVERNSHSIEYRDDKGELLYTGGEIKGLIDVSVVGYRGFNINIYEDDRIWCCEVGGLVGYCEPFVTKNSKKRLALKEAKVKIDLVRKRWQ